MSAYRARIVWERGDQVFTDNRYAREHRWFFDHGCEVVAAASPHIVPLSRTNEAAVDPEEALVASASSCHMLWFLSMAVQGGYRVDAYVDEAEGTMTKDADGKAWISRITLRPVTTFSGDRIPTRVDLERMHHEAHAECFIARSIRSEIVVDPVLRVR